MEHSVVIESSTERRTATGRVRVQVFPTAAEAGWTLQTLQWLGPEERAYGATFQRPQDRERFLASRYRLRTSLEAFTGIAAGRWSFRRNAEGKWIGRSDAPTNGVTFSLAHSGDVVAVALGEGVPVGIDLEPHRDYPLDADAAWTDRERHLLHRLSRRERTLAELRLWTAKEAYLKLIGRGAFADFASVDLAALVPGGDHGGSSRLPAQFRFGSTVLADVRYDVCVAFGDADTRPHQLEIPTWLEEQRWNRSA